MPSSTCCAWAPRLQMIANATAKAAENSLASAASDPALRHAFWLLTQLPLAARSTDFAERLVELEIDAGTAPSASVACGRISSDRSMRAFGMPRSRPISARWRNSPPRRLLPQFWPLICRGCSGRPARTFATRSVSWQRRIASRSSLANFFARLANRNLEYFISRAIADHIGPGRGFRSLDDQAVFRQALAQHCYEAALDCRDILPSMVLENKLARRRNTGEGCRLCPRCLQEAPRRAASEGSRCLSGSSTAAGPLHLGTSIGPPN